MQNRFSRLYSPGGSTGLTRWLQYATGCLGLRVRPPNLFSPGARDTHLTPVTWPHKCTCELASKSIEQLKPYARKKLQSVAQCTCTELAIENSCSTWQTLSDLKCSINVRNCSAFHASKIKFTHYTFINIKTVTRVFRGANSEDFVILSCAVLIGKQSVWQREGRTDVSIIAKTSYTRKNCHKRGHVHKLPFRPAAEAGLSIGCVSAFGA